MRRTDGVPQFLGPNEVDCNAEESRDPINVCNLRSYHASVLLFISDEARYGHSHPYS